MAGRPIVVLDTSVFLRDALSRTKAGAASRILRIVSDVAHIVMCDEMRDELVETLSDRAGWSSGQIEDVYGQLLDRVHFVTPVSEEEHHRTVVNEDATDTVFVRTAEAVYVELTELLERDQPRLVISENTRHFRPGSNYAGFLFVTARGALDVLL